MSGTTSSVGWRFSWRKAGLIALILLLLLLAAHFFWSKYEQRLFLAQIRQYRAAGEPVLADDFNQQTADAPDNPVSEWRAAAKALDPATKDLLERAEPYELDFPLTEKEAAALHEIVAPNQALFDHARSASQLGGRPDWGIRFTSPTILVLLSDLGPQRQVARVLSAAAMDAHHRGDDAQAIELLHELLSQRRAILQQPALVSHLVAIGVGAMTCDTLDKIAPTLKIGQEDHAASANQVRQLISELLNETDQRAGQRRALLGERMFEADLAQQIATGRLSVTGAAGINSSQSNASGSKAVGYALSPLAYADGRLCLRYTTRVMQIAQAADLPTYRRSASTLPPAQSLHNGLHFVAAIALPAFDRAVLQEYRILAETRMAAVALAGRWYADDHDGRLPTRLEDLVPQYLPAVPLDPMAAGNALNYRGGENAIVYSVGEDGRDDGGSEKPLNASRPGFRWDQEDAVIHLTPQPRKPPTETQDEAPQPPDTTAPTTEPATAPAA